MLTSNHPHAWNADHAGDHIPADFARHYLPAGSTLVVTPQMRALIAGMPSALDRGAAIAVSGPYGAGKSTTITALAAVSDINTAVVNIPPKSTEKAQWQAISSAIVGDDTLTGTARQLQNIAREHLTADPTLLIVDEAQFIGRSAMLQLRWLWEHNFPRFAIVLAGSDLFTRLETEPSVATRIDRRIELRHHTHTRMVDLLRAHHPLCAATDPALLAVIDHAHPHGSWRLWSKLLHCVTHDMGHTLTEHGPITPAVAEQALHVVTGQRIDLAPHTPAARRAQGSHGTQGTQGTQGLGNRSRSDAASVPVPARS